MAGHSHWAGIKHKKAAADKKRGKIFSKLAKAIIVAARVGGGDPDGNARLRLAIEKAKAANMPKENIERAIKRGTGELDGVTYEEITYEGVGPQGIAIIAEVLTDNRNRTVAEVRKIFDTHGGTFGTSVAWNFSQKGVFTIPKKEGLSEEQLTELALEGGAEDVVDQGDFFEIITDPGDFESMKKILEENQIEMENAEVTLVPQNTVKIEDPSLAKKALKLLEALDEHDDIQKVHTNCEFPENMEAD
ncbi:MAG: YebC/PmpR family DNA-binding transcriptional regulator [Planctomycetota bacterium]|nr:MAG: YebC/PmpR family DNA-binding transcriptional regulator [Planctomycetota bacterium]